MSPPAKSQHRRIPRNACRSGKHQRGYLLLEAIIAVAITTVLAVSAMWVMGEQSATASARGAAAQLELVNNAVTTYLTERFGDLTKPNGTNPPSTPNVVHALAPTTAELRTLKYLPADVSDTCHVPGQTGACTFTIQISLVPAGCVPPACGLEALTWMTQPVRKPDTGTVDTVRLGAMVDRIGGRAGASLPGAGTTFSGWGGKWQAPNPTGVEGLVVMRTGYASEGFDQFYRRDGTRSLTGPLAGGNQDANDLNRISGRQVVLPGSAPEALAFGAIGNTTTATIGNDGTRLLVSGRPLAASEVQGLIDANFALRPDADSRLKGLSADVEIVERNRAQLKDLLPRLVYINSAQVRDGTVVDVQCPQRAGVEKIARVSLSFFSAGDPGDAIAAYATGSGPFTIRLTRNNVSMPDAVANADFYCHIP